MGPPPSRLRRDMEDEVEIVPLQEAGIKARATEVRSGRAGARPSKRQTTRRVQQGYDRKQGRSRYQPACLLGRPQDSQGLSREGLWRMP